MDEEPNIRPGPLYLISPNFCSRSFDAHLALIPTPEKPSRTFFALLNPVQLHYGRSTALPIIGLRIGLREGSPNNPECPLTCARSSSTIAFNSSISS